MAATAPFQPIDSLADAPDDTYRHIVKQFLESQAYREWTAAELMGLEKELGTIEPGKRADVVMIDGDPFDFAKLGDHVTAVYKDGRRVVSS